jgi:hypothetical protein
MAQLIVQLNHPGNEKPFKIGKGYQIVNDKFVREWNDDPRHYRKFIKNEGEYINALGEKPDRANLIFWGEWEGNSLFHPINNGKSSPNGIHVPFHSTITRGCENTDPYIYGEYFKYAICKQSGQLCNLDKNSLILFGTVYPSINAFFMDTVFVIGDYDSAQTVSESNGSNFTSTYREETLEQFEENDYLRLNTKSKLRLYHGITYDENKNYFSFVPCKVDQEKAFQRLKIDLNDPWFGLSANPTGKSFLRNCKGTPHEAWERLVLMAFEQGFYLGVKFYEPQKNDQILKGSTIKQPITKASFGVN